MFGMAAVNHFLCKCLVIISLCVHLAVVKLRALILRVRRRACAGARDCKVRKIPFHRSIWEEGPNTSPYLGTVYDNIVSLLNLDMSDLTHDSSDYVEL